MLLGGRLRRLRERKGLRQLQAAQAITCSNSKISNLERGKLHVKEADVAALLDLYGVPDGPARDKLLEKARYANTLGWWHAYRDVFPDWFMTYIGLESAAFEIRTFEPQLIPGLLQTPRYMRAVTSDGPGSARLVSRRVALRQRRQKRVFDSDTVFRAVIDEGALRRPIGGRDVMREQLDHLLDLIQERRTTLRIEVLPFARSGPPGQVAFSYLKFADREMSELSSDPGLFQNDFFLEVVYHEYLTNAVYLDKPGEIEQYRAAFERLSGAAHHVDDDSAEIIAKIRAKL